MKHLYLTLLLLSAFFSTSLSQNTDPEKAEIITTDLQNFWVAFDKAKPDFTPSVFQELYLDKGSNGVKGFTRGRIKSAEHLSDVIKRHPNYYASIRASTDSIAGLKTHIHRSFVRMKELYPKAIFPPVYFVIGALSSGGTSSDDALIIGAEMYGLTANTPKEELGDWLRTVIKPMSQAPHIVAHELIHYQQNYDGGDLLSASVKEGSADFIAELISGRHINQHVHDFANPKEKELWLEFKEQMLKKDYNGWLYSASEGRPNDLGYWMGYKITKSYYDNSINKKKAIEEILNIRDFEKFLAASKYAEKFK